MALLAGWNPDNDKALQYRTSDFLAPSQDELMAIKPDWHLGDDGWIAF